MRIALISDLHGNLVSLEAVFQDIERTGVDETICLGDVATLGPRPREVVDAQRERNCRCILGNHDAFMLDDELIKTYTEVPIVVDAVDWCRDTLAKDDIEYFEKFRTTMPIELGKHTSAFLFHGSPRSHMEDLLATTPPDDLDEALGKSSATVLAGGHTHIQMMRQHRGMLLVNPGSVGMPFREYVAGCAPHILPYAEYGVIEADDHAVRVSLRRVAVDKTKLYAESKASPNPICRALEKTYG